jgi:hypothetical protein
MLYKPVRNKAIGTVIGSGEVSMAELPNTRIWMRVQDGKNTRVHLSRCQTHGDVWPRILMSQHPTSI